MTALVASARQPVDVRLAAGAGAAWLGLVLCGGRSASTVAVLAAAAFACAVLALISRRGSPVASAVGLVGFCIALALTPYAGRLAQARASPLATLAAARSAVTARLTVVGDPHPLAAKGVAGSPRVAVTTEVRSVDVRGRRWSVSGPVLILAPAAPWRDVLPGQRVVVDGTLQPSLEPAPLGATLFSNGGPTLIGQPPWWQRAAARVRSSLRQASSALPSAERGLLPGLVDGDTTGLDPVLVERFRVAGLTHLVAVSGTNCSILIGTVLLVLRRMRVRPWLCAVCAAAVLVAFVVVARGSPSVLRAAVMAAIALVSLAVGRPRQAVPSLAAAVLVLLVWDPSLAADAGFAMSALATAALLLLAPSWADALRRRRVPAGVAEALAVAAAAHLVTAPVVAALYGRVSLVAIPANALAEPVVAAATVLGFLAAVTSPFWLQGGEFAAQLAGWPCRWLVWVADRFGGLDGAMLPWPHGSSGGLALLAATVALLLLARRTGMGRLLAVGAVVAALVQIPVRSFAPGWPPSGWLMVACDVGQGDALVLSAGGSSAVEVDTGPDPVAVDRCLRSLDVSSVALLVLTHFHLDHVGGIVGVLHGRRVGRVVTGPLLDPASGVWLVDTVLRTHGLARSTLPPGTSIDVGRVHLDVLGPSAAFHGTRSDPNNSSVVLRATIGGLRILLPGDAEVEAQQALLDSGTDLRADVLKVPHHGSAYSAPDFLAAVHARVGVISVGAHNDYGHPSPLLLSEMERLAVPIRRTDRDGDVAVVGGRDSLTTVSRRAVTVTASGLGCGPTCASAAGPTCGSPAFRACVWPSGLPGSESGGPRTLGSAPGVRMAAWPSDPSASTSCRARCRPWSFWSAMRSYSSVARSARSPPQCAAVTATSTSPSVSAPRSRVRNCTSCWGRRCSETRGWW